MDVRELYDGMHRDPEDSPLFARIWDVLTMAPSSKYASDEELISLAGDAFDYLQANGAWATSSATGRTELHWNGQVLRVRENDDRGFKYERGFTIR